MDGRMYLTLVVGVMAGLFSTSQAQTRPAVNAAASADDAAVISARERARALPSIGVFQIGEVARFRFSPGGLHVVVSDTIRRQGRHRLKVQGNSAVWTVSYYGPRLGRQGRGDNITLTRFDFDEAARGGIWSTSLRVMDQEFSITAQAARGAARTIISLRCSAGQVRLTVLEPRGVAENVKARNAEAGNLLDFRSQHPGDYRKHVLPLFIKLAGDDPLRIRAADAYRAFPELRPDAGTKHRLEDLLARMGSPVPKERDQASAELARLGAKGILAAIQVDTTSLMPERRSRLEQFIAEHDDQRTVDPAAARKDPLFLVDCLEFADPVVQSAARDLLQKMMGREIEFDPASEGEARAAAMERLRAQAIRMRLPEAATRPATGATLAE